MQDEPESPFALMWRKSIQEKGNNVDTHQLNKDVYIPQVDEFFEIRDQNKKIVDLKNVEYFIRQMFPKESECTIIQSSDGKS